ncbi:MAG: type II toxin-antitoxin system PemK/MazF family toxin [Pseudomonadota bacterium]
MALSYHPKPGTIVRVDYSSGFTEPEMVKRRLAVVLSPAIKARPGLVTVVALSTTDPSPQMPYHALVDIPFELPAGWGRRPRWVKGDMVNAVGFHRVDLLAIGKGPNGKRRYQTKVLPKADFTKVRQCVLHGLGLSTLTKHL